MQWHQRRDSAFDMVNKTKLRPLFSAIASTLAYLAFMIMSIVTYIIINNRLPLDSPTVKSWIEHYEKGGCGTFNTKYALQTGCLLGCGTLTIMVFTYVFFIYRVKPEAGVVELLDGENPKRAVLQVLTRLFVVTLLILPLAIPVLTVDIEHLGSAVAYLVLCEVIPLTLGGFLLGGGPYDLLVQKIETLF